MEFFKHFPQIDYTFDDRTVRVTDLLTRVSLNDVLPVSQDILYKYTTHEADTVDRIANEYYESVDLWWLVYMSSQIFDPVTEWPIDQLTLNSYLVEKWRQSSIDASFGSSDTQVLTYMRDTIFEYRDSDGDVIDLDTYNSLAPSERSEITILDYELEQNDARRDIELATVTLTGQAVDQLEDFLQSKNDTGLL